MTLNGPALELACERVAIIRHLPFSRIHAYAEQLAARKHHAPETADEAAAWAATRVEEDVRAYGHDTGATR